jgi:hypothetical protein
MNKRGQEMVYKWLFSLIILVLLAVALLTWISGQASGKAAKAQIAAKELALLINSAKPYTIIETNANVQIAAKEKELILRIEEGSYSYDFFSPYNLTAIKVENKTLIEVK